MTLHQNPTPPNWQEIELEDTWPDDINLKTPSGWYRLVKSIFGKRQPVTLPASTQARFPVPKYILQEFHNLPNGNYSRRFSRGYVTGFDISMLGMVDHARRWIADQLKGCSAVADVGTSGGKTASFIHKLGVEKVWGIDPSPYLLKHASHDHPDIDFLHGTAERMPFADLSLDGISVCFVFHEIPPKHALIALKEFNRCLAHGGKVAISEPSELQLERVKLRELARAKGWLKAYFHWLANFVYEPFLMAWHKQDKTKLAEQAGFEMIEFRREMPINLFLLRKRQDI